MVRTVRRSDQSGERRKRRPAEANDRSGTSVLQFFLVFIGSGIGGMARLALGSFAFSHTADWRFPLGTFVVNAIGCLAAGILAGLIERWGLGIERRPHATSAMIVLVVDLVEAALKRSRL